MARALDPYHRIRATVAAVFLLTVVAMALATTHARVPRQAQSVAPAVLAPAAVAPAAAAIVPGTVAPAAARHAQPGAARSLRGG